MNAATGTHSDCDSHSIHLHADVPLSTSADGMGAACLVGLQALEQLARSHLALCLELALQDGYGDFIFVAAYNPSENHRAQTGCAINLQRPIDPQFHLRADGKVPISAKR